MNLEIGMYVRTYDGFVSKIIEIETEPISGNEIVLIKGNYKGDKDEEYGYVRDYYKQDTSFVYRGEIKKSSHSIIDLIELGDYVNGERVQYKTHSEQLISDGGYDILKKYTGISSVVTKEQFNDRKYEVYE